MTAPTHIVPQPGSRTALCGQTDPLPKVAADYAAGHRYPQARCEVCYQTAGLAWMLTAWNPSGEQTLFTVEGT